MVESNILMEMRFQGITCQEKTLYFKSANLCLKSIIIFKISILFQIHKTFFQIDIYFSNLQSFNPKSIFMFKIDKIIFQIDNYISNLHFTSNHKTIFQINIYLSNLCLLNTNL